MQTGKPLIAKALRVTLTFGVVLIVLGLFGCGEPRESSPSKLRTFVVGVNQFAPHPILDSVYKGMAARLSREGNIQLTTKNANGDRVTCQQINEQFVQSKVDVIVALGTPAAQSAVAASKGIIPVVFGAITDPVGAKLADSLEQPGGNRTGTSNRWPFGRHVELLKKLFPDVTRVGILVNPAEPNCEAGMVVIRAAAKELGLSLVEVPIASSADVVPAVESLRGRVEVILISPSNDVFSALDALLGQAKRLGLPVVGGDESAVTRGALATYGFSNEEVGTATAECVLRVLKGDTPAGAIPVSLPPQAHLYLNRTALSAAGVRIPQDLDHETK
jgi:putative ABC transport system substrate-binding protein